MTQKIYPHKKSYQILSETISNFPKLLITLGSGWNKVLEDATIEQELPYSELFGVEASVPGHEGRLIIAQVDGQKVAFMSGRLHMYEGYTAEEVNRPLQVFAKAGLKKVVLTAACGAINEKYQVGDFVLLSDLLTVFMSLDNPLIGPQFQDMSQVFNQDWRQQTKKLLSKNDIKFQEGIYAYYHGPNFETPADKMAFKILGADVVGMSTVPEAIMARSLDLRVQGISFVTNLAFVKHSHQDVVATAEASAEQMVTVIKEIINHQFKVNL
jgi:purine-nucleoside phosphorylase